MKRYSVMILLSILLMVFSFTACKRSERSTKKAHESEKIFKPFGDDGTTLQLNFERGKAHNHPSLAIWIEDLEGEMIQTLFVTKSVATGYYAYGDAGNGKWLKVPGPAQRYASLPYWLHRRELANPASEKLPTPQNPVPDAYTGATPTGSFTLKTTSFEKLTSKFKLFVEVNQPWDWNEYWNNSRFENDPNYHSSAQPSVIYAVTVDLADDFFVYQLNPIGHGHYAGDDGRLYTNISTLTTALTIFESISLELSE
ncbi:MAG: DUF2271 domain-containing protein [Bacteroidales bacterium]|nr:DUF2271 domain-containing protein [Bacteroidales bacterium]